MTGAELQAEDTQILAGLPPRVHAALDRRAEARRRARFGSKSMAERMVEVCERDAASLRDSR